MENITAPPKLGIVDTYIFFHDYGQEKYGKKAVVVMREGSFYDIYHHKDGRGPKLEIFSNLLSAVIFHKGEHSGVGIPDVSIEYRIGQLNNAGYIVLRVEQTTNPNAKRKEKKGRYLSRVYDKSTYSTPDLDSDYKGTEKHQDKLGIFFHLFIMEIPQTPETLSFQPLICAITVIEVSSGDIEVYEVYNNAQDPNYALDQVARLSYQKTPSEIFVSINNMQNLDRYLQQAKLADAVILGKVPKEYYKIDYQLQFLAQAYSKTGSLNVIQYLGLERNQASIISLMASIERISKFYPPLVTSLRKPIMLHDTNYVIVSNNALVQLDILNSRNGKSIYDILNQCSTRMGTRLLRHRICNPITNVEELNRRYDNIGKFVRKKRWKEMEKHLTGLIDLDQANRKIEIGSFSPAALCKLIECYEQIILIFNSIPEKWAMINVELISKMTKMTSYLKVIDIEVSSQITSIEGIDKNIFLGDNYEALDILSGTLSENIETREEICQQLSELVGINNKNKNLPITIEKNNTDYFLSATTTNYNHLLKILAKHPLVMTINSKTLEFNKDDHSTISDKKNRKGFTFPCLRELSNEYYENVELFSQATKTEYSKFLRKIVRKFGTIMRQVAQTVAELDFCTALAKVAVKHKYCRPVIDENSKIPTAYIKTTNLRHPIIEMEIDHEYVPHNVLLGCEQEEDQENTATGDIILIYGANMGGKSSLLRAIGVAEWMALIGSYVAAEHFTYFPVTAIYTRILTEDNPGKGISAFQCEMLELAPILSRSDENSLILADELCHSTTVDDATSLVAASIIKMAQNKAKAILTSHFHDVADIPEVVAIPGLKIYHVATKIGKQIKFLHNIVPGVGPRKYGIEMAVTCGLPAEVAAESYTIRNRRTEESEQFLTFKHSRYSSKVYMGKCQRCGKPAKETHHKRQRKDAVNGFVDHVPLNSKANLEILCEECHLKHHKVEN